MQDGLQPRRAEVRSSAESAAACVAGAAAIFLNRFPKHEEDCAQDCAGQVWYEVSETAMALTGKPLGQFNVDSHRQHRAQRNQELVTRSPAAHLRARHQKEDGEPPEMPIIRER